MTVLTPIFGAIFLRNNGLGVGTEDGGGDDGGAKWELGVDGEAIGKGADGGKSGGSIISSTIVGGSGSIFSSTTTGDGSIFSSTSGVDSKIKYHEVFD